MVVVPGAGDGDSDCGGSGGDGGGRRCMKKTFWRYSLARCEINDAAKWESAK